MQGELSKQVVTIPEVLRETGYHTYMTASGIWVKDQVKIRSTVDLKKHLFLEPVAEVTGMTKRPCHRCKKWIIPEMENRLNCPKIFILQQLIPIP